MPAPKHHAINYVEFAAGDLPAMKEFYGTAFGWTFTDYGPDYAAFNSGTVDGGFAKGESEGGGPLVILFSEDLEASLGMVEKCGGTIVKKIYSFPGGRRFHFKDPGGNELAIWAEA